MLYSGLLDTDSRRRSDNLIKLITRWVKDSPLRIRLRGGPR